MKCRDLMKMDLVWIAETASVLEAARMMRDRSVGMLLVGGPSPEKTVGVFTDWDLAVRVCAESLSPPVTRVGDVATTELITCDGDEDLHVAEELMRQGKSSHLLVVDQTQNTLGILSLKDVLRGDRAMAPTIAAEVDPSANPGEGIFLTPSTVEDEESTLNRPHSVTMGEHRGSMKEFPG